MPQPGPRREADCVSRRFLERPIGYRSWHRLSFNDEIERIRSSRREPKTAWQNRRRSHPRDENDLDEPAVDLRRKIYKLQGCGNLPQAAAKAAPTSVDRRLDRSRNEKNRGARRRLAA